MIEQALVVTRQLPGLPNVMYCVVLPPTVEQTTKEGIDNSTSWMKARADYAIKSCKDKYPEFEYAVWGTTFVQIL